MAADLQGWLDGDLFRALFERLPEAFPEFGWRRQGRKYTATRWPTNVPEACQNPKPDRLFCYENLPGGFHIHGRRTVPWIEFVAGHPRPRGPAFLAAVRDLAQRAGVDAGILDRGEPSPEEQDRRHSLEERRSALTIAARVAWQRLHSPAGEAARSYLINDRGLLPEDLEAFQVGLYDLADVDRALKAAGLRDDPRAPVRFAGLEGYIVLPWADAWGYPLTLYGRWPGKSAPEGSPKTTTLPGEGTKASPLYLDRALRAGHRELVAVEGIFDALVLQARGDSRAVAYVAAQFNNAQLDLLARRGIERVYLCGDPDGGGDKGTGRNVEHLQARGIRTAVVPRLPEGLDPDEFVQREGLETWRSRVEQSTPGRVWQAERMLSGLTPTAPELQRRRTLGELRVFWATLAGPEAAIDRESIVHLAAERTGYDRATVEACLTGGAPPGEKAREGPPPHPPPEEASTNPPPPPTWPTLAALVARLEAAPEKLPVGIDAIDKGWRGGAPAGLLWVLGGAPGSGKTTLATWLAHRWAQQGVPVGFIAGDEPRDGILIRLGQQAGMDRTFLEEGRPVALGDLSKHLAPLPLHLLDPDDDDGVSVERVADWLREQHPRGPAVLIIDSLQALARRIPDHVADSPREKVNGFLKIAKAAAKRHGLLVICLSELARGAYRGGSEQTSDLAATKESGAIEYECGALCVLRPVEEDPGLVTVTWAKSRPGRVEPFSLRQCHARATFAAESPPKKKTEANPEEAYREVLALVLALVKRAPGVAGARAVAARLGKRKADVLTAIGELLDRGALENRGSPRHPRLFAAGGGQGGGAPVGSEGSEGGNPGGGDPGGDDPGGGGDG